MLNVKNNPVINRPYSSEGFTVLEVIIIVVIITIFFFGFITSYRVLESQRLLVDKRARASYIAYTNLSKVSQRPSQLVQAVCTANSADMDLTVGDPSTESGLDLTSYGYTLESSSSVQATLGSDATQSLVAYAPDGCTSFDTSPIKIVATVSFGGENITHATYIH